MIEKTRPDAPTIRPLPDEDVMYRALVDRDSRFEGIFVVGVRTTGIFCRPTCPARKPKRENVEFLPTSKDALVRGYRPCKLCRPMEAAGSTPRWLKSLLDDVDESPTRRWTDEDLRRRDLEPSRVRRWFNRHHGMTFHAYCRFLRLSAAFGRIRDGDDVASAAFGSGYESLSGFSHAFKRATGSTPSDSRGRAHVAVTRITTPLGPMLAAATDDGLCLLEFADRRMLETQLSRLRSLLHADLFPGDGPHLATLEGQLAEYFDGTRRAFDLPLVVPGTPFQQTVWAELQAIPYGETRSYQGVAESVGQTSAVRAVARANGDNRIAILIPCHRVIGKNGRLTGYGGGLWRKRFLLDLERKYAKA
jgi:AraC family transcriptional regulator of adaptative response/methylated-DNA-[protein]-cysteine methyltransferase